MKKPFLIIAAAASFILVSQSNRILAHEQDRIHHEIVNIPDDRPIPSVELIVHPDVKQGWNLQIQTTNFKFVPEKVNQKGNLSEGHAHLYVNGEKINRIYGNWYYLSVLKPGTNEIKIQLNTNDHKILMYHQQPIEDVKIIEVQ